MDYMNNYNNSNSNNNDIIIICNKDKIYQNPNLSEEHNNNYETYEMLQAKIIELNNKINFIKYNSIGIMSDEDIYTKINPIMENIDFIIEQINFKIINKAQIFNYKKIIKNENEHS